MEEIKEACGIEIGEYIRTSGYYSFISKIKRIEFDNEAQLFWFIYDKKDFDTNITREWRINKPYIKKHSFNIIDLIEVGDYVNTMKVKRVLNPNIHGQLQIECAGGEINYPWAIKSIVTKEQFANIEYKVEE